MTLLRAIFTVGGYTLISRVFGFIRDIIIASVLGAGATADAFFVAFRFPNLFRRLFAEGAFSAAFVPIFSGALETEGHEAAKKFVDESFTILALILFAFVAIIELAMPWAIYLLAPGFDAVEGKIEMVTEMSRIAFPYLLFISLVSLQSGVLNSLHHFAAAAAAPVLLNLTLIAAVIGFSGIAKTPGHALSWGVFVAGIAQFIWLAVHCRRGGFPVTLRRPRLSPKVRLLGQRILPVIFGASLYQINLLIGTILASFVSNGAVSYLYYADRVTQVPLGVVGIAVGTALLPALSRQLKAEKYAEAEASQNRGLEFALLLTLPATAALIAISGPIISVLFERGQFSAEASAATATALMAYATGLPAYVLIRVLTPGFFAREDTATPVRIAAAGMLVNIILNLILLRAWGHVGIATAASVSAWVNAIFLALVLHRRGHLKIDDRLRRRVPRIVVAALGMGVGLLAVAVPLEPYIAASQMVRITTLAALVAGGLAVFAALAQIFGGASWSDLKALRRNSGEA